MDRKSMRRQPATTLCVDEGGGLTMKIGPGGFEAGFSQLMNLSVPTFAPKPLAAGETTRVGFARTGDAIASALTKARVRFGR